MSGGVAEVTGAIPSSRADPNDLRPTYGAIRLRLLTPYELRLTALFIWLDLDNSICGTYKTNDDGDINVNDIMPIEINQSKKRYGKAI
ncbi:hypothetical protein CWO84_10870 [Methylomonas sp. Kb3]|uniref:hypothetical protein n=1 Tax=Methylomonas sp. Kb3 TaxID=1611544 RepID=UPI000C32F2C2|nr:hypothetical protein [Methylomonas sp. Kb3]PKD40097.1 hypothetical protein CWO84_10870 [Methylomonas sp. Kb3]